MDWNRFKIFLAVADTKGLVAAAEHLNISHTTVFRQLKALESDIGTRLFERVGGAYQLTTAGERFYGKLRLMSAIVEEATTDVSGQDHIAEGKVVITAPSSLAHKFFPEYLNAFYQIHPQIQITLLVGETELDMSARKADIAFRVTKSPPENLVGKKILSIPWGVYASQHYIEDYGIPHNIQQLKGHKYIGAEGKLANHEVFRKIESLAGLTSTTRTDDISAMPLLALTGHGLGFFPYDLGDESLEKCFTFELAEQNSLWVLMHPDLRKLERIKVVSQFLTSKLQNDVRITPA